MLGMYYFDPVANQPVILGANDQFEVVACTSATAITTACGNLD